MKMKLSWAVALAALAFAAQAAAQVTFYDQEGFRGRAFTANGTVVNFDRTGFNDRASSMIIDGGRWEICEDAGFHGRCVIVRRGQYPSLNSIGMGNRISSIRPAGRDDRYSEAPPPPVPVPAYEYYPRHGERLFSADVTSVHAVVGPPEQRCWVERQQVGGDSGPNVPGAIIGGIVGGVLGHQVGGGRGQDIATAGGAVGGALLGSNVGRGNGGGYSQDVQRCSTVHGGRPEYWDVTYVFRGQEHRVQMTTPPGRTIPVNGRGEPRL